MRYLTVVVVVGVLCAVPAAAMMMVEPYPAEGNISSLSSSPTPRADLDSVMNFAGRIYGEHSFFSELGDWENVFWRGTTEDFNKFLQVYSKVKVTPLWLVIHVGSRPEARAQFGGAPETNQCPGEPAVPHDWHYDWHFSRHLAEPARKLGETAAETVQVDVWVGPSVQLDVLVVPPNITVKSGGELEEFVSKHSGGSGDK